MAQESPEAEVSTERIEARVYENKGHHGMHLYSFFQNTDGPVAIAQQGINNGEPELIFRKRAIVLRSMDDFFRLAFLAHVRVNFGSPPKARIFVSEDLLHFFHIRESFCIFPQLSISI